MNRILSILVLGLVLTACAQTDNSSGEQEQIMDQLDPNRENKIQNTSNLNDKLGYVNYTRDQLNQDTEEHHAATIDRVQMADMIARIILRNEGFNRVATLVTDEEVLIAYDRNEELDQNIAADIASKTAASVMPRFYHIYVSDNETLIQDIQSLHNSSTQNKEYDNTLDQIISQMKKSPQGMENSQEEMAD
ncbi:YhcN/YlaJ family sporulation lipoprotein [Paucisalibacillus sp. EB02]|uniref:YhcN/YlaJ family sporulation lipoprotein n=1 Tax=Paucisalibacillus sp. EB02 TaxID=1347087 RepID=UPI0004B80C8F|nr:YhcN/YlaJ family sporulation lipoprotein [Paucisalibacillus sp. EB02]